VDTIHDMRSLMAVVLHISVGGVKIQAW
jgi:hypothetical protein